MLSQGNAEELPVGSAPFPRPAERLYRSLQVRRLAKFLARLTSLRLGIHWLRPTSTSTDDRNAAEGIHTRKVTAATSHGR